MMTCQVPVPPCDAVEMRGAEMSGSMHRIRLGARQRGEHQVPELAVGERVSLVS